MKITIIKGIVTDDKGNDHAAGEILDIDNEKAKRLISLGYAAESKGSPETSSEGNPEKPTGAKK